VKEGDKVPLFGFIDGGWAPAAARARLETLERARYAAPVSAVWVSHPTKAARALHGGKRQHRNKDSDDRGGK